MDLSRHGPIALLLIGVFCGSGSAQTTSGPYQLGTGLPLGDSGVRLGGYVAVEFENPADARAAFVFDDLSLFVFGDIGSRVRFFTEIEDAHFLELSSAGAEVEHHIDLERLYVDYLHSDGFGLRTGKFLTPVGTWNEIHPDPLTWTVSRPVASFATFPVFTTGMQAFGTFARDRLDIDYVAYVQVNPSIDANSGARRTERMAGARVRVRQRSWQVGIPLVSFEDQFGARTTLTGADLVVNSGPAEVRGELTAGRARAAGASGSAAEYAYYLQALLAVSDRHMLVTRHEKARAGSGERYEAFSLGTLFRVHPAMSVKLEYQWRTGRLPVDGVGTGNQLLASFGVLF